MELTTESESLMMLQRRWSMKRSIDMMSDSGLSIQESDYASHIQAVLNELRQMQQTPQLVTSPEELEALGRDPLLCPHCHHEMDVWKVWHPKYGVVYDELEAMRRGRYASTGRSTSG